MADFDTCILTTLKHEGGFVDNPLDHGGPTNYGITLTTLCDYLGHDIDTEFLKTMSQDTAKQIYKKNYWDRLLLDQVNNNNIATVVMDLSVLMGMSSIVKIIQNLAAIPPDGIMGPMTLGFLNHDSDKIIGLSIIEEAQKHFVSIAQKNTSQLTFLGGWINRTQSLLNMIFT